MISDSDGLTGDDGGCLPRVTRGDPTPISYSTSWVWLFEASLDLSVFSLLRVLWCEIVRKKRQKSDFYVVVSNERMGPKLLLLNQTLAESQHVYTHAVSCYSCSS